MSISDARLTQSGGLRGLQAGTVRVLQDYETVGVPGAPTALGGTAGDAQVVLTWTAPASNGGSAITDYEVQYRTGSGLAVYTDTFATTANPLGAPWTRRNGTNSMQSIGGQAVPVANAIDATYHYADMSSPDHWVEADIRCDDGFAGVQARIKLPFRNEAVDAVINPSDNFALNKHVNNVETELDYATGAIAGQTFKIRAECLGNNLKMFVDGVLVNEANDAALNDGLGVGIGSFRYSGTLTIDNFAAGLMAGSWTTFSDAVSASTGATVTGLTNGTTYEFQVRAINASGPGLFSAPVTVVPALVVLWKGVGVVPDGHVTADLTLLDASWWYDWSNPSLSHEAAPGFEYVPMMWGDWELDERWELGGPPSEAIGSSTTLLGFNEPNEASQANMTVARALALWPQLEATGARLGSPGPSAGGLAWLASFMAASPRVDFICAHWYADADGGSTSLSARLDYLWATYGLPIWLTETGNLTGGVSVNAALIPTIIDILTTRPWVERVAWFSARDNTGWTGTGLVNTGGTLNAAGTVYASYPAMIGGEEPPSDWTYDFTAFPAGGTVANWTHQDGDAHTIAAGDGLRSASTGWTRMYTTVADAATEDQSIKAEVSFDSNTSASRIWLYFAVDPPMGGDADLRVQFAGDGSALDLSYQFGGIATGPTWTVPASPFELEVSVVKATGAVAVKIDGVTVWSPTAYNFFTYGMHCGLLVEDATVHKVFHGGLPFSPVDLSNLVGWWDASDATTFTYSSGVLISQWADKSGIGHHLVPRAAPARTTMFTPNGTPTVHFDNSPLERNAAIHSGVPTLTFFAVARQVSDPHDRSFSWGPGSGDDYAQVGAVAINPESGPPFGVYPSGYRNGTQIATKGDLSLYNTWISMIYVWDATGNRLYVDGVLTDTKTGSPGNWNITNFTIGGSMSGGNVGAIMQVAEVGLYTDAKSPSEITQISDYLTDKWGL